MERETITKKRYTRTAWFWIVIAVGALVAACGLTVLVESLVYHNEVHPGVSVHGVDLGGMTKDEATVALTRLVDSAGPITLKSGNTTWLVTPAAVGTAMDVQGAVAEAMAVSRKSNFFGDVVTRFKLYFDGRDLPLTGTVDQAKLDALLSGIAKELHVTPVNAGLAIQGSTINVIEGRNGQDVDTAALGAQLESLFVSLHSATLDVPIVVQEPGVQAEDNQAAKQAAETMMSAPITLTDHDKQWTLTPEQIASFMDFRSEEQNGVPILVPYVSEGKMWLFLQSLAPDVKRDPVDARFASDDGATLRVIPSVNGETLDPTATVKALNATALKPAGRTVEVAVTITEPDFTTAEAEATSFDQLSSFTTKYVGTANRRVNVRITTKYATGVFLAPGEVYNADKQIGPRTPARGYKLAPGIVGQDKVEDVYGGGICQVSTTIFNAVFFAGLEVLERHNHSLFIHHYPRGRDATVTDGGKNLRFRNDTGHYLWIVGTSNGVTTTITIFGTSDGRKVTYQTSGFYHTSSGVHVKVTRQVTMPDGTVLHDDIFVSTWATLASPF